MSNARHSTDGCLSPRVRMSSKKKNISKIKQAFFRVTPEQLKSIEERAQRQGMATGVWMRSVVLQAVGQRANRGYLRIREPDSATT